MRMISDGSRVDRLIGRIGLNKFSFAHGEAFIVANIGSYFLNRTFTFAGEPIEDTSRSIGAFFAVSAFSLVISVLLINFLTINQAVLSFSRTNKYLEKYWPTIAKFLSIFVTLITNFIGYKFLAF